MINTEKITNVWGWASRKTHLFPQSCDSWGYSCLSKNSNYLRKDSQFGFPDPEAGEAKAKGKGQGPSAGPLIKGVGVSLA